LSGIALFDVDGVLVNGFTMMSLGRLLFRRGILPRRRWLKVLADYAAYRTGAISYAQFAATSKPDFALALAGLSKAKVVQAAKELCQKRLRLYWYAEPLVKLFRGHDILTVAISGAPEECMPPLKTRLGLGEFYGTIFEVDSRGAYTGRISRNMAIRASKEAVTNALRQRADFSNSFAFGDTDQDLPLLENVAHPVAMNPKGELLKIAAARGWKVITYRHHVLRQVRVLFGELVPGHLSDPG